MEVHCLLDSATVSPLANLVVIITAICLISGSNCVLRVCVCVCVLAHVLNNPRHKCYCTVT